MNLPFSPTFFRKMDIFQQLMEYECQKDKKHLWEGEKAVLIWSGSEHHQHLGSAIDTQHVQNALEYCEKAGFIKKEDKERLQGSVAHILTSLSVHEYGKAESDPAQRNDLIINKNGILAGQILIETKNLQNVGNYQKWSRDWWVLYFGAGLLIAVQVINGLIDLIKHLFNSYHFFSLEP